MRCFADFASASSGNSTVAGLALRTPQTCAIASTLLSTSTTMRSGARRATLAITLPEWVASLAAPGTVIQGENIQFLHPAAARLEPAAAQAAPQAGGSLRPLRAVEREHIQRVLDATNWNKKRAARVLEIGRETLYRKIDEFNLSPSLVAGTAALPARPDGGGELTGPGR